MYGIPTVMKPDRIKSLEAGYNEVAQTYVDRIYGELVHKPLDCKLLDAFAAEVKGTGNVCDLGCGPGHVSRYLRDRGVDVIGLDLAGGMLAHAQRLNPDITFLQGDMTALTQPDGAWAGIVAFYSLIHVPRGEMVDALRGLRRVLRDGAPLFVAFHLGEEDLRIEDFLGHTVSLDFFLFQSREMTVYLQSAGFEVETITERDPYPGVEHPSRRSYILARKPKGAR
jgi:SAM-dependent methyltransferase